MPKPAPRKQKLNWKLWFRLFIWACIAAGIALGANEVKAFMLRDPRFGLNCEAGQAECPTLEIHGAVYASRARLQAVFAHDFGASVFSIDLAERRRHLLAVDWVGSARI